MSQTFVPYGIGCHCIPAVAADAVVVDHLTVGYPGSNRPALKDVSLRVACGTRVALVGPNGAGKSSLIKALIGLLPVHSGSARLFGHDIGCCPALIAYLPQRGEIDWRFPIRVDRFLLTGRYVHLGWFRWPQARDRQFVAEAAEKLNLTGLLHRQIGQLSGGQQQRALLGRALVQGADLLLLDEPLNAVDSASRDLIRAVLTDHKVRGKTMVVATHEQGWHEGDFDDIIHLREGRRLASPPGGWTGWQAWKGPACPG